MRISSASVRSSGCSALSWQHHQRCPHCVSYNEINIYLIQSLHKALSLVFTLCSCVNVWGLKVMLCVNELGDSKLLLFWNESQVQHLQPVQRVGVWIAVLNDWIKTYIWQRNKADFDRLERKGKEKKKISCCSYSCKSVSTYQLCRSSNRHLVCSSLLRQSGFLSVATDSRLYFMVDFKWSTQ